MLSCAAAFKVLAQRLFPGFMDGLMSGASERKTTARTRTRGTGGAGDTYALQSRDRTGFRTITRIEAGSGIGTTTATTTTTKQLQGHGDSDSVDSRERIVEGAAAAAGWPPRMETTISVHSSKRDSADDERPANKTADHLFAK